MWVYMYDIEINWIELKLKNWIELNWIELKGANNYTLERENNRDCVNSIEGKRLVTVFGM